jgi:hypothetical protein
MQDCKHDPDHAIICLTMRILGWMEFSERTGLGEREGEWQAVSGPFTLSESASARVDDATNTRATSVAALRDIAADVSQVIDTDGVLGTHISRLPRFDQ